MKKYLFLAFLFFLSLPQQLFGCPIVQSNECRSDTLILPSVNNPYLDFYPFPRAYTLHDLSQQYPFLSSERRKDYQGWAEYGFLTGDKAQIVLNLSCSAAINRPLSLVYANIADPRIRIGKRLYVGMKRSKLMRLLHVRADDKAFPVVTLTDSMDNIATFTFSADTLCRVELRTSSDALYNPRPVGFYVPPGQLRGYRGPKLYASKVEEVVDSVCYLNERGDTIVPYGKILYCGWDSIAPIGVVMEPSGGMMVMDVSGRLLYGVVTIDNLMPDGLSEGVFRIVDSNGRMGYADAFGNIVIPPQFLWAEPFENGKALVTCTGHIRENIEEHSWWVSDDWFYINKKGERIADTGTP